MKLTRVAASSPAPSITLRSPYNADHVTTPIHPMPTLQISLLGPLQVRLSGVPAHFRTDAMRVLLAYLARHEGVPQRRDRLADLLSPDRPNPAALTYLRNRLTLLRKALKDDEAVPPWFMVDRKQIMLRTGDDVLVDLSRDEAPTEEAAPAEEEAPTEGSEANSSSPAGSGTVLEFSQMTGENTFTVEVDFDSFVPDFGDGVTGGVGVRPLIDPESQEVSSEGFNITEVTKSDEKQSSVVLSWDVEDERINRALRLGPGSAVTVEGMSDPAPELSIGDPFLIFASDTEDGGLQIDFQFYTDESRSTTAGGFVFTIPGSVVSASENTEAPTAVPTEEPAPSDEEASVEAAAAGAQDELCTDLPTPNPGFATLRFINRSGEPRTILWNNNITANPPELVAYKTIRDGETYDQRTYPTHQWTVQNSNGESMLNYIASKDAAQCVMLR